MNVNFRKLQSFVKIIDTGSVSRAAALLRTAQPALSQQIASLESYFKQQLLIRSNVGIKPTEAGSILYCHAQLMLKQLEQARLDMNEASGELAGRVSIGLATYSTSSSLSLRILQIMQQKYPHILVHINDSFGLILSELIMTGKMDMAIIYGADPIKGVMMQPLFREEMMLAAPENFACGSAIEDNKLALAALDGVPLLLPSRGHFLRKLIDDSLNRAKVEANLVCELESVTALAAAVEAGLGATILPASVIRSLEVFSGLAVFSLTKPAIEATVSLCICDRLPLSEPALAARSVVLEAITEMMQSHSSAVHPLR